jgi:hypothetical protein
VAVIPATVGGPRQIGDGDATSPDLSAFRRAGGKLIVWQGWADQNLPPSGTVDYYKAAVRYAGGFPASQAFTRLYMIPGQYHCLDGGSPPVNGLATVNRLLAGLISWVERGAAPGTFSFPLAHPAGTPRAIQVHPLNPLSPPHGGSRGLNTPLPLDRPLPARRRTVVHHQGHEPHLPALGTQSGR